MPGPWPPRVYTGRLAPSPTGLLHLGHVRTFAVAHRRAHAAGGTLRLRIDDLDPARSRPEFVAALQDDLLWLGLAPRDQPPVPPLFQSCRTAAYLAGWQALVAGGHLYPCRCTRRELHGLAQAPHESSFSGPPADPGEPIYPGTCRPSPMWAQTQIQTQIQAPVPPASGAPSGTQTAAMTGAAAAAENATGPETWLRRGPAGYNWRFRVPTGHAISFHDGHLGPQHFIAGHHFGDFLVWRRDGLPAYQLATVLDDAAMGITEVVRGADLLLSTARQLLLGDALGLPAPAWFHCPLVLDPAGKRLAKRTGALSIQALRARGLRPSQILAMAAAARTEP